VLLAIISVSNIPIKIHDFISKEFTDNILDKNPPVFIINDPLLKDHNTKIIEAIKLNHYKLSHHNFDSAQILLSALNSKDKELVTAKIVQVSEKNNLPPAQFIINLIEDKSLHKLIEILNKYPEINEVMTSVARLTNMMKDAHKYQGMRSKMEIQN
jgi:hypothetical protein